MSIEKSRIKEAFPNLTDDLINEVIDFAEYLGSKKQKKQEQQSFKPSDFKGVLKDFKSRVNLDEEIKNMRNQWNRDIY